MTKTDSPTPARSVAERYAGPFVLALMVVLAVAGGFIYVTMASQNTPEHKAAVRACVEANIYSRSPTTLRCA